MIILFFVGCTNNKKTTSSNTPNIPSLTTNIIKLEPEPPTPITILYKNGLDLILADRNENKINHILLREYENYRKYYSIYWDKKNHHHYYTFIKKYTNDFLYSLDSNFQQETTLVKQYTEFIVNNIPLLYIGSISPLERIYVNTNDDSTYLKCLVLIDDLFYLTDEQAPKTNQNINSAFPVVFTLSYNYGCTDIPMVTTLYTNENIYSRYPRNRGMLQIKKENMSLEEMFIEIAPYFIIEELYPTEHEFNG
ncbi:MAG: hypothetical protein ACRCWI_02850 [Brevinema sp.]